MRLTYVNEGDGFLSPFVYDQVAEAHVTLDLVVAHSGVYLAPILTATSIIVSRVTQMPHESSS
jgi:hypothetical protein